MNQANNYLIYYNYLGKAFRSSYLQPTTNSSPRATTVQDCLHSALSSIATSSSALTVGVYTTASANALANTATVRLDLDKRLDSPTQIQFVVNKRLAQRRVPLKVFRVAKVANEFCARKNVKGLEYVLRFCQADERSRLSVFERSFVTCLDEQVDSNRLKNCLHTLRLPFKLRDGGGNFFGDEQKYESRFGEVELNVPPGGDLLVRFYSLFLVSAKRLLNLWVEKMGAIVEGLVSGREMSGGFDGTTPLGLDGGETAVNLSGLFLRDVKY